MRWVANEESARGLAILGRGPCVGHWLFPLAAHLLVILPLGIWLYATPVAMPQAPLSAVLKGPGEVTHPASREAQHHAPLSAGEKAKPVVAKRLVPTLSKKEADRALEKPQAVTPVTTGTAQGDPSVTPNAASRSGVQGGAPDTARDGVDADALQRYRLALGMEARKARRYPEVSRARGHEGQCEVMVMLSRSGGGAHRDLGKKQWFSHAG